MEHFLSDAKRLVQRLHNHDNAVDILISETTNLQNKLIAMRQYRDEINKMNQNANHRPRSTLILGSQLENQRIQNLEQENRELSISLAEHQSALELIMNKYREQVLIMMKSNGTDMALRNSSQPTKSEIMMSEKIAEMAYVMRQSASIDESVAAKEIEALRSLQVENDNLRELLEISGKRDKNSKLTKECPVMNGFEGNTVSAVENKDSGIYEQEFSPNIDIMKSGRKQHRVRISKSKHVNSLENLFKKPEEDNQHVNDDSNSNMEQHLDENSSYKLYTVENFVPNEDVGLQPIDNRKDIEPQEPLTNGDFLDIFRKNSEINKEENFPSEALHINNETPDEISSISNAHDDNNVNIELKGVFIRNSNLSCEADKSKTKNTEPEGSEEYSLQMLDDVINFDIDDNSVDDEEEEYNSENYDSTILKSLSTKDTFVPEVGIVGGVELKIESHDGQESKSYDFVDTGSSSDVTIIGMDETLENTSDVESETTVTGDDEEDALAMFDDLDDEFDNSGGEEDASDEFR